MPDLALGPDGDLEITRGKLRIVRGPEAFAQRWPFIVTLFKGEWFLDRNKGIDYQGQILVKAPRLKVIRALFVRATRADRDVKAVPKMRLELKAGRTLVVEGEAVVGDEVVPLSLNEAVGGS